MEELHIVKEFMIGNTRMRIADNCCRDKTPEQVEEILKRIAHRAQLQLSYAAQQKVSESKIEKPLAGAVGKQNRKRL